MKTKQMIAALSEMIGENTRFKTSPEIKLNNRFCLAAIFVNDDTLEIMDNHGHWRKLDRDNEDRWLTFEMDEKDNWKEVDEKWAEEQDIFAQLESHFNLQPALRQAA